ncbi:hypothetical protein [Gloeobacter violaceus]|uniref:hypothetical protein n=1 Tax=Gloeobacter violaceus TaxID=33072 RepID=UPI0013E8E50C|nr:hypothetical protein [Gloeobacter violaceus]
MSQGKNKKTKDPKITEKPSSAKTPRFGNDPDEFYTLSPAWRLSKLEMVEPFGWHKVDGATLASIRSKLASFESMTWKEILCDASTKNHFIGVDRLCLEARQRLEEIKQGDIDQLMSLRLGGKQRVWGIVDQGIMTVLWWDPDHKVYPVNKKHT